MWSQVLYVLFLSVFGASVSEVREKRTIGVLFRGLIDAVTRPTGLTYPPDETERRTTPRPDSRPQTQIFFVPLPQKQREIRPPAPLKPADLAEIHIHPNLVRQLETLVRTQAIRGRMIAKRYPMNTTLGEQVEDNIKAGDYQEEVKETSVVQATLPKQPPMKYMVKILPETNKEKGGVAVTIAVGKDGKIRIIPGKEKINLDVEMNETKPHNNSNENSTNSDGQRNPTVALLPPGFTFPLGPVYTTGTPIVPVYIGTVPGSPFHPNSLPPAPVGHPQYSEVYPPYPPTPGYHHHSQPVGNYPVNNPHQPPVVHPAPRPYSEVNPFSDFLNVLGLGDEPSPRQPPHFHPQHDQPHQNDHPTQHDQPPQHDQPHHNMTQVKMIKYTDESSHTHHSPPGFPLNISNQNQHQFFQAGPQPFPPGGVLPFNPESQSLTSQFPQPFPPGGVLPFNPESQSLTSQVPQPFPPGVLPFNPGSQSLTSQDSQQFPAGPHSFPLGLPPFNPGHQSFPQGSQSFNQVTASYPQLPPLPNHQGHAENTIGNGFPSPQFSPNVPSGLKYGYRPLQGPPNFPPSSQFAFPQSPFRYPPTHPLSRKKKQVRDCNNHIDSFC